MAEQENNKDVVFSIRVPKDVFKMLEEQKAARGMNMSEVVRMHIGLGMLVLSDDPKDPKFYLKVDGELRPVILIVV